MPRRFACSLVLAVVLLVAACGGAPTGGSTPPPTPRPTATPSPTGGPYATLEAAEAYVRTTPTFAALPPAFIRPEQTWRPAATLHVLHATPTGTASYGGDTYFFFVRGNALGRQRFTKATSEKPVDDRTFAVTYTAYNPGDPHCCATGGSHDVRFQWNGTAVVPLDPLTGAEQG